MLENDFTWLLDQGKRLADVVEANVPEIINILVGYESQVTAVDEISRTLSCLRGLRNELPYLTAHVGRIASFLPINQPLYGLTLFAIVPSLMASDEVAVRPPVAARSVIRQLHTLLDIPVHLPKIRIVEIERREFLENYVRHSDVILFVGRYLNAVNVLKFCRSDSLFVFNGAGINPFLLCEDANIDLAVRKVMEAKLYNSGQDCAAPDVILVHKDVIDLFIERLREGLSSVSVGMYDRKENVVGPLIDQRSVTRALEILQKNKSSVVHGGLIDAPNNIVYPAILQTQLSAGCFFEELYAPIFLVSEFRTMRELEIYFSDSRYLDHAMYLSTFGKASYRLSVNKTVLIEEGSILDYEQGNRAFGGYGRHANFSVSRGRSIARPILISKEIWDHTHWSEY